VTLVCASARTHAEQLAPHSHTQADSPWTVVSPLFWLLQLPLLGLEALVDCPMGGEMRAAAAAAAAVDRDLVGQVRKRAAPCYFNAQALYLVIHCTYQKPMLRRKQGQRLHVGACWGAVRYQTTAGTMTLRAL